MIPTIQVEPGRHILWSQSGIAHPIYEEKLATGTPKILHV